MRNANAVRHPLSPYGKPIHRPLPSCLLFFFPLFLLPLLLATQISKQPVCRKKTKCRRKKKNRTTDGTHTKNNAKICPKSRAMRPGGQPPLTSKSAQSNLLPLALALAFPCPVHRKCIPLHISTIQQYQTYFVPTECIKHIFPIFPYIMYQLYAATIPTNTTTRRRPSFSSNFFLHFSIMPFIPESCPPACHRQNSFKPGHVFRIKRETFACHHFCRPFLRVLLFLLLSIIIIFEGKAWAVCRLKNGKLDASSC